MRAQTGRKALILLTDGEDEGSETKPKAAIAAAENANAIIYVIMIADRGFYFGGGYRHGLFGRLPDAAADRGDRRPGDQRGQ